MTWIFQTCTDQYGSCIRQYVIFGISLVVSVLALYSCIKTYKRQKLSFQLLPLAINTLTSLILLGFYTQIEVHNTRLILFVVEFYSYFILCFGFVALVMKQTQSMTDIFKIMQKIFLAITFLSIVALIVLGILGVEDIINCKEDQGVGSIIMIVLQLGLIVVTFYFSSKFKKLLKSTNYRETEYMNESKAASNHLLNQEDQYISLKKMQLNLVRITLIVNFALHFTQIMCYYVGDSEVLCYGKQLKVTNSLQLFILYFQNISELFPHFMIPFIFWYLPLRIASRANTVFISQNTSKFKQIMNTESEENRHLPKIKMASRQESQFYKDMHNDDSIRQKLIPKIKTPRTSTL